VTGVSVVRHTAFACVAGAVLALAGFSLAGSWHVGVGLAFGLLLGAANVILIERAATKTGAVRIASLGRLGLLSALGLGLGLLIAPITAVFVIVGMAGAMLLVSVVAAYEAVHS